MISLESFMNFCCYNMNVLPDYYAINCLMSDVPDQDVKLSAALTFEEMSENSKRNLEASGEWELVTIMGDASILKFGIDEWDIITFWVRKECLCVCVRESDHEKKSTPHPPTEGSGIRHLLAVSSLTEGILSPPSTRW